MTFKTKIRILLTFAAGFAAGRASASLRVCPAACPLNQEQNAIPQKKFSEAEKSAEEKEPLTPIVSGGAAEIAETPPSCGISDTQKASAEYIGNSLSKVFHHSSCRYCSGTASGHRVEFDSAEDAKSQGYKPCRRCLPEDSEKEKNT